MLLIRSATGRDQVILERCSRRADKAALCHRRSGAGQHPGPRLTTIRSCRRSCGADRLADLSHVLDVAYAGASRVMARAAAIGPDRRLKM